MRYSLGRKDYEQLMVLGHGETFHSVRHEDAPAGQQEEWLETEYPKSTEQAVLELKARGFDVSIPMVQYLIKKQSILMPKSEGRLFKWTAAAIDRLADRLEREQLYTPETVARMIDNVDPGQDVRAQRQALADNPQLMGNRSLLVKEVIPGAPGLGIYATVKYRAMTKEEQADLNRKAKAAKEGR